MTTWRSTSLSVSPPAIDVADTDVHVLEFAAGEAIASGGVDLRDLGTGETVADIITDTTTDTSANTVTVTMSGFVRDAVYELSVIFTRADGTAWTRTLAIRCVA